MRAMKKWLSLIGAAAMAFSLTILPGAEKVSAAEGTEGGSNQRCGSGTESARAEGRKSVSYTHLDVYKRQGHTWGGMEL